MSPSSIHGLPTEILVLIFDYGGHLCLHEEGLPFAVKASHVSRQWRDVALGTPFVWSGIPVHPSRPTLTDHYLARSENSPLDVYFHFKKQVKVGEALTHLLRHRRRWRNLYVDAGTGGVVFVVILSLKDAGSSLPILQHFELNFTGKPTTIGRLPEIFTDSTPPKLCSLTMRGTSFNMLSPVFRNATQLDLSFLPRDMGNPTFSTFNLLMSGLTNLTHLKLASVFPKLIEGVDYGSIELPLLHTLELVMHKEEDYVPLFFSIICAPTLHTLRFESKWSTTWDGFLSCVDITSATFANLQNLALTMTMSAMPDSVTVYPELFMGFPELKILSLSAFHDDLIMRVFLWPWMHICDVGDMNPLDDYERIVFYDFSNMAIWPNLELLVVRAPFDASLAGEEEEEVKLELEEALDVLGSLRLSSGSPFDISPRDVFEDYIPDPLDVE